jgi:conjugative relaxase-like TrwC/TraI family protein
VITAKAQYNLANAKSYFREHLAVGDYYREGQQVSGEWFGEAAKALNLTGAVSEAEFLALCENEHPQNGGCLTQRKNSVRQEGGETIINRRVFYDFTFSPPKSVSVAALVAGDERILEAHGGDGASLKAHGGIRTAKGQANLGGRTSVTRFAVACHAESKQTG